MSEFTSAQRAEIVDIVCGLLPDLLARLHLLELDRLGERVRRLEDRIVVKEAVDEVLGAR
jgi:hypothetical protein